MGVVETWTTGRDGGRGGNICKDAERRRQKRKRVNERDQLSTEHLETNDTMSQINTQDVSSSDPSSAKVLASNQSRHIFSIFVY